MKVKIFLWQLDRQISNVRCYDLIWSGKNVQCLHFFLFLQEVGNFIFQVVLT